MAELKPRPFCGGEAKFLKETATIKCKDCGGAFICTNPLISRLEVAEVWNNRKPDERLIPKKVTHEATLHKDCTCPNCGNVVSDFEKWGDQEIMLTVDYCRFCGQALDWRFDNG